MVADSRPEPPPKRSFIARFFIFLFKFILLIAVLVAGGALGALGATWINLSNATDTAQDRRLDGLQLETAKQGILAAQIADVSGQANTMTAEVDSLTSETAALAADLAALSDTVSAQTALVDAQEAQIATLTEAQTGILNDLTAAMDDVENLAETTAGLRRNLTTSSQSATGISDSVIALEEQVASLSENLAEIEATVSLTNTAVVSGSQPAETVTVAPIAAVVTTESGTELTLVRLLGYIARAKIHLLESDSGSAASALDSAIELTNTLSDESDQTEQLAALVENLEAAQANLESKPAASAIALDAAWDSLDALLVGPSN
ncbi:MAG: hypothetical protein AB8G95_24400 [Anaerolineae bacterium]